MSEEADLALMYGLETENDRVQVEALAITYGLIDELGRRRIELGLTQSQVAERMGTSQAAVAKMENHRHDPQLSTIARYVAALRLPVEDLASILLDLSRDEEPQIDTPAEELPEISDMHHDPIEDSTNRDVVQGHQVVLTQREIEILTHISMGKSPSEIGLDLFISKHTVEGHTRRLLSKLRAQESKGHATIGPVVRARVGAE